MYEVPASLVYLFVEGSYCLSVNDFVLTPYGSSLLFGEGEILCIHAANIGVERIVFSEFFRNACDTSLVESPYFIGTLLRKEVPFSSIDSTCKSANILINCKMYLLICSS